MPFGGAQLVAEAEALEEKASQPGMDVLIVQRLGLSLSSVETYRKTIASKLGVSGPELVRLAVLLRCTATLVTPEG